MCGRCVALILAALVVLGTGAIADGILFPVERPHSTIVVPDELFTVKYHRVNVDINDQVAVTKVDQIFHNDTSREREGMYVFPVPEGSAITKFSMFAGANENVGKILDKNEARGIYESIVRQRRDPALLEYIDRNTFRASVFPIPANGDKRIRLDYSEIVKKSGNTCRYVYSLSTERFSARPLEDCKVTIHLHAKHPITNIYSPTHTIDIERISDLEANITWSAKDVKPDTDLVLYYTLSNDDIGIDLIGHKVAGKDGYYLLLASPRVEIDRSKVQPKKVIFVFDRTGSMAGNKIDQTKEAINFCLGTLRSDDLFNVITFNETPKLVFSEMRKATKENVKAAISAVDGVDASGGTDIDLAMKKAMKQFAGTGTERNYIVFLTDGQPTVGTVDNEVILKDVKASDTRNVKLFAFGVGYDVNTHLLDKLAEQSKGDTDYVRPNENIEIKVSSFFGKVSEPLLSDVKVKVNGVEVSDVFPSDDLPDIFKGSQLIILGRYKSSGKVKIELSGISNDTRRTFVLNSSLPAEEDSNDFIAQLWASRKIGYLLDQIRLHSSTELIDEVVRLSKEYGIPTEYTSFLADDRANTVALDASVARAKVLVDEAVKVETGSYGVAQSTNARNSRFQAQAPQATASAGYGGPSGAAAPPQVVLGKMAANSRAGGVYFDSQNRQVVAANVQNIAMRTFYQRGDYWEDADLKKDQKFVQIKQFSDAHFQLLAKYPKLAQYSTLGNVRLVLENNQGIEIGPQGKDKLTDAEAKAILKGVSS